MRSSHQTGLIRTATESMSREPALAATVAQYCRRMNDGEYDREYLDTLMQKPWGFYDFYDAWGFSQVHSRLCIGEIVATKVQVGVGPAKDKEFEENNARLADLPNGFQAKFLGGSGDNDGHIEWSMDIELGQYLPDGKPIRFRMKPGRASLEVGFTELSSTMLHLQMEGALARWPYDQKWITLYVDRNLFGLQPIEGDPPEQTKL